tara:strand:+ start:753 stop:938 length:186 start_codon:yes stop_codon:yes gene_type:complete
MFNFKKNLLQWLIWLLLVILWNYGYPQASPLQDVIVAVLLSLIFILLKFFFIKNEKTNHYF